MESPSCFYGSRKKNNRWVSSAAECRREVLQSLGRFYLLALTQPGKSVMDASPKSLAGTPGYRGKGGKNEKMDHADHGKVRGRYQGGRGAAQEGTATKKLESGSVHILREDRYCVTTRQCRSWGFRYWNLSSRPATGPWDGCCSQACSGKHVPGVGCSGRGQLFTAYASASH